MSTRIEAAPASGRMAAATSKNNWRGKYLRALNIMAPEVDIRRKQLVVTATTTASKPRAQQPRRTRSYRAALDGDDALQARGSSKFQVVRTSAAVQHTELRSSSSKNYAYGFALKPELARGRRCLTDPIEDKVGSAPIQIPTTMADATLMRKEYQTGKLSEIAATRNNRSVRHLQWSIPSNQEVHKSHGSRPKVSDNGALLWGRPETMVATPAAPERSLEKMGGLDIAFGSMAIASATDSHRSQHELQGLTCDEFVETEDEEEEDEGSEDDQIFEMEDFDRQDDRSNQTGNNTFSSSYSRGARTKERRPRTASESLAIGSRARSTAAMHRFHSVRQMRTDGGGMDLLPESFVPPHELVQRRDCFSMGLRGEFKKRRPAKI